MPLPPRKPCATCDHQERWHGKTLGCAATIEATKAPCSCVKFKAKRQRKRAP